MNVHCKINELSLARCGRVSYYYYVFTCTVLLLADSLAAAPKTYYFVLLLFIYMPFARIYTMTQIQLYLDEYNILYTLYKISCCLCTCKSVRMTIIYIIIHFLLLWLPVLCSCYCRHFRITE